MASPDQRIEFLEQQPELRKHLAVHEDARGRIFLCGRMIRNHLMQSAKLNIPESMLNRH